MTVADPDRGWRRRGPLRRPATRVRFSNSPESRSGFPAWLRWTASISICAAARCMCCSARTAPASRRSINIIAGTYPPDDGAFNYQGEAVGRLTPHAARLHRDQPGLPGIQPGAGTHRRAESLPRSRIDAAASLDRSAHDAQRRSAVIERARLRPRARPQGARSCRAPISRWSRSPRPSSPTSRLSSSTSRPRR